MGDHRRFFICPEQISGGEARITGSTAHQIARVLRLKEGDTVCLLDGLGNEHDARITALSKAGITATILGTRPSAGEPALHLVLAVCMPKGDKLDLIVQKCSELGISKIVVVNSERTVTRLDPAKAAERLARWRRIAAEAAEQAGRGRVPEVEGMVDFDDLAAGLGECSLALVAWEDEGHTPMRDVLRENAGVGSVTMIVGPEGGLSEREVEAARSAGARCVTLGRRVLRCETAAIAACAAIMYELEGEL